MNTYVSADLVVLADHTRPTPLTFYASMDPGIFCSPRIIRSSLDNPLLEAGAARDGGSWVNHRDFQTR